MACEQGPCPSHAQTLLTSRQSPAASMALSPITVEELGQMIQELLTKKSNYLTFI